MKKILELKLERFAKPPTHTVGRLGFKGFDENGAVVEENPFIYNTLEDTVRVLNSAADVVRGQTAIPAGRYKVIVNESPKFKRRLPRLLNVPFFEGILIHRGNTVADTDGCILPGKNDKVGWVSNSTAAEEALIKLIDQYELCWIEIV
jgi:hypothetical protein